MDEATKNLVEAARELAREVNFSCKCVYDPQYDAAIVRTCDGCKLKGDVLVWAYHVEHGTMPTPTYDPRNQTSHQSGKR